jgi:hypothetical protein
VSLSPGGGGVELLGDGLGTTQPGSPVKITRWHFPRFEPVELQRVVRPSFAGSRLFGDLDSFAVYELRGTALSADEWLGLTPGTNLYDAASGGALLGVTGRFLGETTELVNAGPTELLASAGLCSRFCFPLAWPWPHNGYCVSSAYFQSADYVPDPHGIVTYRGSMFSLSYWLVVRVLNWGY